MLISFYNMSAGRIYKEYLEIGMECLKRKIERKNLTHNKELGPGSLIALKSDCTTIPYISLH